MKRQKAKIKYKFLKDLTQEDLDLLKDGHWGVVDDDKCIIDIFSYYQDIRKDPIERMADDKSYEWEGYLKTLYKRGYKKEDLRFFHIEKLI